ncbi:TPA: hypothetical protein RPR69_003343 [Escherichia coli]|nr:hypothetical protein [Escherichia coli]HDX6503421.1 hypothetical protein [Escherichia coli]
MSQTAITLAFENWKAQQGATGEPVLLDEFVFASVPDLNPDIPICFCAGLRGTWSDRSPQKTVFSVCSFVSW